MKATIESAGAVASRVVLGRHELVFDQASPVPGGEDRGPSPLDVVAVAVGACAHYYAAAFLHARGLSPTGLRVDVEFEKVREPVPRIGRLCMRITVPDTLLPRYLGALERAVRHCPAYGTLLHPPEVTLELSPAPSGATTAA